MDQCLDWLDANAALVLSPHAWVWASTTAIIALGCLVAIANVARHYTSANTDVME
jgi:hypothetical protein